jgi:hypothetical protein
MDVHPPHEPIHSWRDFFIHLITITIGLLIALGLEGVVEWGHHRSLVREARKDIREEFEINHQLVSKNLASVHADEQRIAADIKTLVSLRAGKKIQHGELAYTVTWSSFGDSAWKTAQTSGALGYIDFKSAQELSDVYAEQDFASASATRIYRNQTLAISPLFITGDPNQMSAHETQLCLERSADLLLDLRSLEEILQQLDRQYSEQLKRM